MLVSREKSKSQLFILFTSYILHCSVIIDSAKVVSEDRVRIMKFEDCGKKDLGIRTVSSEMRVLKGGLVALDGVWEVSEDLGNVNKQLMKMTKCKSMTERETCEYFTTVKSSDVCKMLTMKGQFWTNLFEALSPKFICPVKKGTYVMKNGTLDAGAVAANPAMKGFYWELKQKVFTDQGRYVFCFVLGMDVASYLGKRGYTEDKGVHFYPLTIKTMYRDSVKVT